jgi:multidrug efflux pump subunit AcrA (membrane-fusion protein)
VEADLNTITLAPEAEQRLGIETAIVERRAVAQTRMLGGEVISPPTGASELARYDASSNLSAADLAKAQIDANGAVERAQVAVELARTRFERVSSLVAAQVESTRALEDAQAELGVAEANLRAAESQRALLGQSVSSAESTPQVWVRAAVYSGDLPRLDQAAMARVSGLGAGALSRDGRPVAPPVTASAASGTAFMFYEVDNSDGALRMGERVSVDVPTTNDVDALVIPWSAVLFDINGGAWVYERLSDQTYARRRVEVSAVVDEVAVLARGPDEGVEVVSVGGPELFGTEFGVSH